MRTKNILIIAILFLSIFLILYAVVFHHGLSSNHEEWGSFGDYIGGIGGIVLSCSILYYTYLIDKEHKRTENTTQVLKLIDVVGESLTYIQKWQELNTQLDSGCLTLGECEQFKSERNRLELSIRTNYKTTQVLAYHIFKMNLPDVDKLYKTETQHRFYCLLGIVLKIHLH